MCEITEFCKSKKASILSKVQLHQKMSLAFPLVILSHFITATDVKWNTRESQPALRFKISKLT